MSNQELHIHTHAGSDGIAHIDIPVGVVDQDIELVISYALADPRKKGSSKETTSQETSNKTMPNVDHLLGSFDSRDGQFQQSAENTSAFGKAVIDKLSKQGVELP